MFRKPKIKTILLYVFCILIQISLVIEYIYSYERAGKVEIFLNQQNILNKKATGRTRLVVPLEYLGDKPPRAETDYIEIYAQLPSATPFRLSYLFDYKKLAETDPNVIEIKISQIGKANGLQTPHDRSYDFFHEIGWYRYEEPSDVEGMNIYLNSLTDYSSPAGLQSVYYVPVSASKTTDVWIECVINPTQNPEHYHCEMEDRDLIHGMMLEIRVSKKYSKDWLDIRRKARVLVSSFIKPDQE